MNRREAVKYISVLLGGTMVGSQFLISGCKNRDAGSLSFTDDDVIYLGDIADTILPPTKTPGAKEAGVGEFIPLIVNDCYDAEDQKIFHEGMHKLNDYAKETYGNPFTKLAASQKHDLLVALDKEQQDYQKNKKPEERTHYFRMMKELTLFGYFTSEIGCTVARRYVETPGKYDGDVPYKEGDKAWAS